MMDKKKESVDTAKITYIRGTNKFRISIQGVEPLYADKVEIDSMAMIVMLHDNTLSGIRDN